MSDGSKWEAYFERWKARHADVVDPDAVFRHELGWRELLNRAVERIRTNPAFWGARLEGSKEKFGCLVLHIPADYGAPGCRPEVERLREEIRLMSLATCEVCGGQDRLRIGSFAKTVCEEHAAAMEEFREDDGACADPWKWSE